MSIEPHLMKDEDVLAYCTTENWAWVCTDRRVLKYREGSGTMKQLHDLSFDEISAISLKNTGRKDELGGYGAFSTVLGLLLLFVFGIRLLFLPFTLLFIGAGVYFIHKWMNSEESYFEFRGGGLLQTEGEKWRIDDSAADDPDEVREFVKTVRGQL